MSQEAPKSDSLVSRKDLDDYIADPFNQVLLQDLEEFGWKEMAINFFEWFYKLAERIEQGKPSAALQELDAYKCEGPFRLWLVYHLRNRFDEPLHKAFPRVSAIELPPAFNVIEAEYQRLEKLFPPDMFATINNESIQAKACSAMAREQMVTTVLIGMLQRMIKDAEEKRARELEIRQDERSKLQAELNEAVQATITEMMPKRNPEHTLNRQVLALGFMLKHLGVTNVDKTAQARFIEFLVGKTYKDIYDRVRELDDRVVHRKGEDARYVIKKLNELGLTTIAHDLQEILSKSNL